MELHHRGAPHHLEGGEGLRSRGRAARPPGSGQWEPVVPRAGEAGELGFYSRTANHHQLGSLKQHTSSIRFCGLSGSALSSVQGLAKLQSRCQRNGVFSRMLNGEESASELVLVVTDFISSQLYT